MLNIPVNRYLILFIFLLTGTIYSCQKDSEDMVAATAPAKTDSTLTLSTPGNYLAVKGTLKISLPDSTYTFDASRDSIAFINVHSGDAQYFGITAINKEHSMSFGISSPGNAANNLNSAVAGSQFLLSHADQPNVEYTLPQNIISNDFGKISLVTFKQDSVLAIGTFYTFLTSGNKTGVPYKIKGTFSLQLK